MTDPKNSPPSNGLEPQLSTSDASQQPTAGGPSTADPQTGFQTQELIGDRFRILRYIARGGMGEVYEAQDLELKEHVALKTIRREMSTNVRTMERFRREIQLARKVTHPNVCRIFDVFHHRTPGTDVTFLSMELLQGETLSERLRRIGPIKTEDALPLVQQMADALTAAHKAGVVHRDFKSSNVVLVPSAGGWASVPSKDVRVVVTDFGLARAAESGDASLSATGDIVGTPAYMAPEQVTGDEITPVTDVYALGVVLYEMVTGRLPFEGDSPFSVAMKRLKDPPASPRSHVSDLDPKWEAAILRCLERKPEDRFANVADVARSLAGETVTSPVRWSRWTLTGAVLIMLAAAIGYELRSKFQPPPAQAPTAAAPSIKVRPAVAVLGFKNLSGAPEAAWLSTALSETINSELAAGEKLRTIPGENVARLKSDLSLPDSNSLAQDTLEQIRTRLGTNYVILGSFLAVGGKIRLDLQMQNTETGESVPVTEEGTEAQLLDLVSRTGAKLREKLGAGEITQAQVQAAKATASSDPEAMRYYAEGLAKLRVYDGLGARDLLQKAVNADPKFAIAHSALSEAWSRLGYEAKAKEEIKMAFELSRNLAREQSLLIEAVYHSSNYKRDQAVKNYEALWAVFPDNIDYGLRLAVSQREAYKQKDSLNTLEQIRKLPAPLSEDPRIDLQEELSLMAVPDYKKAEAAAQRAITKARLQRAALIEAEARSNQFTILGWMDRRPEAIAAMQQAHEIYERAGDRTNEAWTLMEMANFEEKTDLKILNQALALYQQIGNRAGVARALQWIARYTELQQGKWVKAAKMYEKPLAMYRETGDKIGLQSVLYDLGRIYDGLGKSEASTKSFEECFAINREIGRKQGIAAAQFVLALGQLTKGQLDSAKKNFRDLIPLWRDQGNKAMENGMLCQLGWISMLEGDLAEAHKQFQRIIGKGSITDTGIIQAPYYYAVLLMEEGNIRQAEELARELVVHPRLETGKPSAWELLARALLLQGKNMEAQKAIHEALSLPKPWKDDLAEIEITSARLLTASGKASDTTKAIKDVKRVVSDMVKLGSVYQEFEARLALGELEMKSGDVARGSADLLALQKDAGAKGFGLFTTKAKKLLSR